MGYYAECKDGRNLGKAEGLAEEHDGKVTLSVSEARLALKEGKGVFCVVHNFGFGFEAAGFAYSEFEFDAFTGPNDPRPKKFVIMDRAKAEEISGYKGPMPRGMAR